MHPPPMQCGIARFFIRGRRKVAARATCHKLWWIEAIVSLLFNVRFGKVNSSHEMGGRPRNKTDKHCFALLDYRCGHKFFLMVASPLALHLPKYCRISVFLALLDTRGTPPNPYTPLFDPTLSLLGESVLHRSTQ